MAVTEDEKKAGERTPEDIVASILKAMEDGNKAEENRFITELIENFLSKKMQIWTWKYIKWHVNKYDIEDIHQDFYAERLLKIIIKYDPVNVEKAKFFTYAELAFKTLCYDYYRRKKANNQMTHDVIARVTQNDANKGMYANLFREYFCDFLGEVNRLRYRKDVEHKILTWHLIGVIDRLNSGRHANEQNRVAAIRDTADLELHVVAVKCETEYQLNLPYRERAYMSAMLNRLKDKNLDTTPFPNDDSLETLCSRWISEVRNWIQNDIEKIYHDQVKDFFTDLA